MKQKIEGCLMVVLFSICLVLSLAVVMFGIGVIASILSMAINGEIECSILPTP